MFVHVFGGEESSEFSKVPYLIKRVSGVFSGAVLNSALIEEIYQV